MLSCKPLKYGFPCISKGLKNRLHGISAFMYRFQFIGIYNTMSFYIFWHMANFLRYEYYVANLKIFS